MHNKGLAPIAVLLIILGAAAAVVFLGPSVGVNLFSAQNPNDGGDNGGSFETKECDEDGLARLMAAYEDSLADDKDFLVTDAQVYEFDDATNSWIVISSTTDETSTTYGTYNEVGTNLLTCNKKYKVWLGDETEEYYRESAVFTAGVGDVKIKLSGANIGAETWSCFDQGTLESTCNITLGSGATSSNLKLQWSSSTADQGHEAPDGFILAIGYNDTAYNKIEPTGVSNFQGKVESNGLPIRTTSCPEMVVKNLVTAANADITKKCWVLPVTSVSDAGSFDIPIYIALESGINPAVAGDCTGGDNGACAFQIAIADEQHFLSTEKDGTPMELGYQGDDEDNIGEGTAASVIVYTN